MTTVKIATWNVNSLRVRLPHVLTWLTENAPDILALQELKLADEDFPFTALQEIGYSALVAGQKTYNGVAILSRTKAYDPIVSFPDFADHQRRLLAATCNGIRIINLYVPNGESVTSLKYQYKLDWLNRLNAFLQTQLAIYPKIIMLGDFNIAPDEQDVYDATSCQGHVLFSEPERKAFKEILHLGFADCFRLLMPDEKAFTWWDYRMNAFKRNRGLRIDHILASSLMSQACQSIYVDKVPRVWERPSDHAPVIAEFVI